MIEFTQYLFPNRTPKTITIERPKEIEELAEKLKDAGVTFDTENNNGEIWMSAYNKAGDPIADAFATNGPKVVDAVDNLIKKAAKALD